MSNIIKSRDNSYIINILDELESGKVFSSKVKASADTEKLPEFVYTGRMIDQISTQIMVSSTGTSHPIVHSNDQGFKLELDKQFKNTYEHMNKLLHYIENQNSVINELQNRLFKLETHKPRPSEGLEKDVKDFKLDANKKFLQN